MSILNSTSPSKKYDDLGIYYRKSFLTQEEVDFLSNYCSSNYHEDEKYEVGFLESNFVKARQENWDQFKQIVSKITSLAKDVYASENIYVNLAQHIQINSSAPVSGLMATQAYRVKDTPDQNGIVVTKFMLPTLEGWNAVDASAASPAWCAIIGLSTDIFEEGGEVSVAGVSEKINSGDIILFRDDVAGSYAVSSFEHTPDINTPVGEVTPNTFKKLLDLTLTDTPEGYW
jgi:hypothetical protein